MIASLALALTACTPADAEQDSSGSSNSALEFRAPLVGAGEFDSGAVETPLVLWFWAPT